MIKTIGCCIASMLMMGCARNREEPVASKQPDHHAVVASASRYDFDAPMPPVPAVVPASAVGNEGVAGTGPDTITIAWAHLKPRLPPDPKSQIIALIHSSAAYKPLHIPAGDSYLWRDKFDPTDSKDHSWKLWIIPKDESDGDVKKWKRWKGEVEFSDVHVNPKQPHIIVVHKEVSDGVHALVDGIAFGACIDDPVCSAGHCGYGEIE